ncbi:MAG TPA: elongation factor G [Planctomycetota bacterium]|nr:elongation factor G [Planctomycetota bacterium]
MAKYDTKDIRNVAFVGHSDSGKTTLADAILYRGKAVGRLGTVEEGTSVFDFEPEEKERRTSIDLGLASVNYLGREINLFDAPGYSDFIAEAICALYAVETAIVCVHAGHGIKVNTRKVWDRAVKIGVARVILINKMDHENADFAKVLGEIRESFGRQCVPLFLPVGQGASFKGVVSLMDKSDPPADLASLAAESKESLYEIDDTMMEEYLEGKVPTPEEILKALPKAIAEGRIVPVLCCSAKKDVGVAEVMDFLAKDLPSPLEVKTHKGVDPEKKEEVVRESKASAHLSGQVFKSVADPFVHKLSYIRVYSGTLTNEVQIFNQRTGKAARMGGMYKPFGKDPRPCTSAIAGDIVCVTKVDDLNTCDTVCDPAHLIHYPAYSFPTPMVSLAVEPKSKQDLARMSESVHKMASSDPTFRFERNTGTAELVISGMSTLHLDIVIHRLKRKFEVQLVTHPPKIALKETILGSAEGHYKHKKQSGGRGQYGEVYLKVRPTTRGEGFKFTDSITQGRIPQQFVPPIEKGVRETMDKGVIAGYPVVDIEVEVFDGSYHDVDSGPESFKLAGSKAFKEAFKAARPALLEPIVNIEIVVPAQHMGHLTGDLNSRRGRIQGMDAQGNLQVIRAQIPMKEIMTYSTDLHSATGGEGSYSIEFSHYDPMPQRLADEVVARATVHKEEEE